MKSRSRPTMTLVGIATLVVTEAIEAIRASHRRFGRRLGDWWGARTPRAEGTTSCRTHCSRHPDPHAPTFTLPPSTSGLPPVDGGPCACRSGPILILDLNLTTKDADGSVVIGNRRLGVAESL